MPARTKIKIKKVAPIWGKNTAQINIAMSTIMLACSLVILLMTGLSAMGFFEFGRNYTCVLLFGGLFICLTPRLFIRALPVNFIKYYMMISGAVFIGIIGADKNIGIYITYALIPILSCLYFEPAFVLQISFVSYIIMILSVYLSSANLPQVLLQRRPRMQMFLAYAAGFTIEYVIVTAILYYLVKRVKKLVEECSNAENANEAKTTFLLNMSHDIRTPMNAILGYSQLMRKQLTDSELIHYQDMIEQSGNLLLSIINNVLDMARIESGKMELDENCSRAGEIVREVCNVFGMEAKKKNLTLEYTVNVEHSYIICDSTKMQEILTNLVSNAVKYTPSGGKVTIISQELPYEKEGYIKIQTSVEDTGIGMSKEFLPHLFDSFSRERNTTAAKVGGTGLGMAIVKSLVDLMDGTIEVESELGRGSRFTITVPHKIADAEYYEKNKKEKSIEKIEFNGKRILLAEDNDLNAEIAMTILEEMGLRVDRAEDGICCVDQYGKKPAGTYDLILMDIQMPNMDGYKATRIIRNLPDRIKAEIPIIAMTANAFAEDRKKALEMGMNGHISKPIDEVKVKEMLAAVLKR